MNTNTQHTEQGNEQIKSALSIERAALASIADGVVISNTDDRVIMLNRAAIRMLRADPETAHGQSVVALFEPFSARGRLTIVEAIARLRADPYSYGQSGAPAETIIEIGSRFAQAHLSPVLTDVGEFLGVVIVLRDITRDVEADRAGSDFVSNVSHELRLPLTAIKGYCDLLLRDALDQLDEDQGRFLQIVQNNADHLVALINDLLDISRVESYRLDLNVQPVQVETIIRDVAAMIRPQCARQGLHLTMEIDSDVGMVMGDSTRLNQVLINLVNNACRRTPEGGRITLSLSSSKDGVQVSITDPGPAISLEDQQKVFQRFHKTADSLANKTYGTGLELPVSKMLIEMHGGQLWVESELEQGSTFTFILPQHIDVTDDDTDSDAVVQTVLVVEDDDDIAQLISLQLRREGFQVFTTAYGEQAVMLAQTESIDLVTLDMMLPDITGMEVLHRLKANSSTSDIPVIIVSVLLPEQTGDASRGAVEHITKPFAFEKLMESIRRTLEAV